MSSAKKDDLVYKDLADRDRIDVIPSITTLFFCNDKIGIFEYAQMLHHGASVELVELGADVAGGPWLIP